MGALGVIGYGLGVIGAGGNVIMNNDYGVLTIEDGTFVAHNYTDKENYQVVQNYATATINGGTFTADAVAIAASAYDGQSSSTTINGGTFTAGSHGSAAALYFFDYDGNSSVNGQKNLKTVIKLLIITPQPHIYKYHALHQYRYGKH